MNKYYWILVQRETFAGKWLGEYITTDHPFVVMKTLHNPQLQEEKIVLLNWKEITKEEYDLYEQ